MKTKVVFILMFLGCANLMAAGQNDLKSQVDALVQPLIQSKKLHGVAVGIITPQGSQVFGYGSDRDKRNKTPDGNTIFMTGSVQKLFEGQLLAQLILEGKVELTTPIDQLLPSDKQQIVNGRAITMVDLATHSSGFPEAAPNPPQIPKKGVSNQKQMEWIFNAAHTVKPSYPPATHYLYSDFGAVLIRDLLTRLMKESYETMVSKRIFEPLGMTSTYEHLPADAYERLAQGHTKQGKSVPVQTPNTPAGAVVGQFYSTPNDMMKFIEASMGIRQSSIQKALEFMQVERYTVNKNFKMGIIWEIRENGREFSKNGGLLGDGFANEVIFNPTKKLGVVLMSNTINPSVDKLAEKIFLQLQKEMPVVAAPAKASAVPAKMN